MEGANGGGVRWSFHVHTRVFSFLDGALKIGRIAAGERARDARGRR